MPKKPKSKSYVQIGSTIINVPPKMVGFDAQHHKHLYNTTTPNHNIAIHNGKPAIKFVRNVKTTRKINKVPFSTKYTTLDEPKKPRQPRQPRQQAQQVIIGLPPPPPPPPARPQQAIATQQRVVAPLVIPQQQIIQQPQIARPIIPFASIQRNVAPLVIPQQQQVAIIPRTQIPAPVLPVATQQRIIAPMQPELRDRLIEEGKNRLKAVKTLQSFAKLANVKKIYRELEGADNLQRIRATAEKIKNTNAGGKIKDVLIAKQEQLKALEVYKQLKEENQKEKERNAAINIQNAIRQKIARIESNNEREMRAHAREVSSTDLVANVIAKSLGKIKVKQEQALLADLVDKAIQEQKQKQELVKSLNIKDLNDNKKLNVLQLASEQSFVNPLLQKQELVKSLNIKDLNNTEKLNVLQLASEQPFVNPIPNPIPIQSLFRRNKAKQELLALKAKQEQEKEQLRLQQEQKQIELDLKLATSSDIIKRTLQKKALKAKGKKQLEELKAKQEKEKEKLKLKQEEEKRKEEIKKQRKEKKKLTQEQKQQNKLALETLRQLQYQREEEKRIVDNEERLRIANEEYKILKEKQKQEKEQLKLQQEQKQKELDLKLATSSDIIKRTIEKKALKEKGKKQLEELKAKQEKEKEELKLKQEKEKERLRLEQEKFRLEQEQKQKELELKLATSSDIIKRTIEKKALKEKGKKQLEELKKQKEELKKQKEEKSLKKKKDAINLFQEKYKKFKETNKDIYDEYYIQQENIIEDFDNKIKNRNVELDKYLKQEKQNTLSSLGTVGSLFSSKEKEAERKDRLKDAKDNIKRIKKEIKDLEFLKKSKLTKEKEKFDGRLKVASGIVQSSKAFNMKILRTLKTNVKLNDKTRKSYLQQEAAEIAIIEKPVANDLSSLNKEKDDKIKKINIQYEKDIDKYKKEIEKYEKIKKENEASTLGSLFISRQEKEGKEKNYKNAISKIKELEKDIKIKERDNFNETKTIEQTFAQKIENYNREINDTKQIIKDKYKRILQNISRVDMEKADKIIKDEQQAILDEEKRLEEEQRRIAKEQAIEKIRLQEEQKKLEISNEIEDTFYNLDKAILNDSNYTDNFFKAKKILDKYERQYPDLFTSKHMKIFKAGNKKMEELDKWFEAKKEEEERLAKEEEDRLKQEEEKAKYWAEFDKIKQEVLPLIRKLKDLYEKRQTMDISEFSKFRKINKDMYDTYKSILQFKNKYDEREWKKIAYEDLSDWNELLKTIRKLTSDDKKEIDKRIEQEKEQKAEKIRLDLSAKYQEETRKKMEEDEKRKQLAQELKARERENAEIVAKALEQAKNEDQKNVARFKNFIEKMTLIENSFLKDPNNIQTLESNIKKFQVIINDYYTFKATLDKDELNRALIEWGISNDDLKTFEKQMATKNGEWEKLIADKKATKQKEQDEKEKRVKTRQKEIQSFVNKIKKIDEEISPLYLTEYASDKDSMTSSQREKLYNKILKLYNTYSDTKRSMSEYEYKYVLEANPEWEIFKRIKEEYLGNEREAIKQLKEEEKKPKKEYTKEEVDSWSFSKVKSFLTEKGYRTAEGLIGPRKGVDPDDVRFAFNAHQRFVRKGEK